MATLNVPPYTVELGPISYRLFLGDELDNQVTENNDLVPVKDLRINGNVVVVVNRESPEHVYRDIHYIFDQQEGRTFIYVPVLNAKVRYFGYVFSSLQAYQAFHDSDQNRGGLYDCQPHEYVVPPGQNDIAPKLKVSKTLTYTPNEQMEGFLVCSRGMYPAINDTGHICMIVPFTPLKSNQTSVIVTYGGRTYMYNSVFRLAIPFHGKAYVLDQVCQLDGPVAEYYRTNPVPVLAADTPIYSNDDEVPVSRIRTFRQLSFEVDHLVEVLPFVPAPNNIAPQALHATSAVEDLLYFSQNTGNLAIPTAAVLPDAPEVPSPESEQAEALEDGPPAHVVNLQSVHEFSVPELGPTIRVKSGPFNYKLLLPAPKRILSVSFMPVLDDNVPGKIWVFNPSDSNPDTRGPYECNPVFTGQDLALMVGAEGQDEFVVKYSGWAFWPLSDYTSHYDVNPTNNGNLKRPEEFVGEEQEPEYPLRQLQGPAILNAPKKTAVTFPLTYDQPSCLKPSIRVGELLASLVMVVPFCDVAIKPEQYMNYRKEIYLVNHEYRIVCPYKGCAFDRDEISRPSIGENYRVRPTPNCDTMEGVFDGPARRILESTTVSTKRHRHLKCGVYSRKPDETKEPGFKFAPTRHHLYRPVLDLDGQLYLISTVEMHVAKANLVKINSTFATIPPRLYICSVENTTTDNNIWLPVAVDDANIWVFKGLKNTHLFQMDNKPPLQMPNASIAFQYENEQDVDIDTDDEEQQKCDIMAKKYKLTTMGKRQRSGTVGAQSNQTRPPSPRPRPPSKRRTDPTQTRSTQPGLIQIAPLPTGIPRPVGSYRGGEALLSSQRTARSDPSVQPSIPRTTSISQDGITTIHTTSLPVRPAQLQLASSRPTLQSLAHLLPQGTRYIPFSGPRQVLPFQPAALAPPSFPAHLTSSRLPDRRSVALPPSAALGRPPSPISPDVDIGQLNEDNAEIQSVEEFQMVEEVVPNVPASDEALSPQVDPSVYAVPRTAVSPLPSRQVERLTSTAGSQPLGPTLTAPIASRARMLDTVQPPPYERLIQRPIVRSRLTGVAQPPVSRRSLNVSLATFDSPVESTTSGTSDNSEESDSSETTESNSSVPSSAAEKRKKRPDAGPRSKK